MKQTGERRTPDLHGRAEERVQDLFHLFPYFYTRDMIEPGDCVLEVGCGDGYGAGILGQRAAEYVGVDLSADAVRHASARYGSATVRFQQADATALPLVEGTFDLVVSFHVIEHLRDTGSYLDELARVSKADGRIVLVTPNRAFRVAVGERPWNRFHVQEFDAPGLTQLLSQHFANVAVMGVAGSDEMNAVERQRVARARRLARMDPLGLRYRLPEPLLIRVRQAISRTATRPSDADGDFTLDDVHCVESDLDTCVHLLAVIERSVQSQAS